MVNSRKSQVELMYWVQNIFHLLNSILKTRGYLWPWLRNTRAVILPTHMYTSPLHPTSFRFLSSTWNSPLCHFPLAAQETGRRGTAREEVVTARLLSSHRQQHCWRSSEALINKPYPCRGISYSLPVFLAPSLTSMLWSQEVQGPYIHIILSFWSYLAVAPSRRRPSVPDRPSLPLPRSSSIPILFWMFWPS